MKRTFKVLVRTRRSIFSYEILADNITHAFKLVRFRHVRPEWLDIHIEAAR